MSQDLLEVAKEIRNWVRAACHAPVKALLENALVDDKARTAYQMTDGTNSIQTIRAACKMSPNDVSALQIRCAQLGLMEANSDGKRCRIFNLEDFGLIPPKSKGIK